MGKIKTVVMGDLEAEEAVRKKAEAKREGKRAEKAATMAKKEALKLEKTEVLDTESLTTGTLDQVIQESKDQVQEIQSSAVQETPEAKEPEKSEKPAKKTAKKVDQRYLFIPGKKYSAAKSLVDQKKLYSPTEAIELVKKTSTSKFDGSVEINYNVTDKNLRGMVTLPHGTGKQTKVVVATDDLINSISSGSSINFDILVASPDMMPKLAKIAKILGPKGLMPNPKNGTIGENPEAIALSLSKGQMQWKTQPDFPIIHAVIGKVSFESKKLEENLLALTKSIGKDKILSVFVKATMGPAVRTTI